MDGKRRLEIGSDMIEALHTFVVRTANDEKATQEDKKIMLEASKWLYDLIIKMPRG